MVLRPTTLSVRVVHGRGIKTRRTVRAGTVLWQEKLLIVADPPAAVEGTSRVRSFQCVVVVPNACPKIGAVLKVVLS